MYAFIIKKIRIFLNCYSEFCNLLKANTLNKYVVIAGCTFVVFYSLLLLLLRVSY